MVIRVEEAAAHVGKEVEIRGWLHNKRSSGSIHFLQVRDGSGRASPRPTTKARSSTFIATRSRDERTSV